MIAALILCILLFAERLTGGIWHALLGLALLVLSGGHIWVHRKKMKYREMMIKVIDWFEIIMLILLIVTGILLHPLQGVMFVKIVHKLAAVLFLIGMLWHMWQHRAKRK